MLHRLDPAELGPPRRLTEGELRFSRERIAPLIRAAQAGLDRLYQAVGGVGCCILLADHEGVPVDRRGAVADDPTFRDWGLWTGTVWSEAAQGTNGIGTCIVDQRTVSIHRDQHFFTRNTDLSCTTAPIFDHEARLAGVLDVSSCRADLTEAFAGLIALAAQDAARRIEAEAFRLAFPDARVLVAPGMDKSGCGLIAIDRDDLVIGATRAARQALGLTAETSGEAAAGRRYHRRPGRRPRRRRTRRAAAGFGAHRRQCLGGGPGTRHRPRDILPQAQATRVVESGLRAAAGAAEPTGADGSIFRRSAERRTNVARLSQFRDSAARSTAPPGLTSKAFVRNFISRRHILRRPPDGRKQ